MLSKKILIFIVISIILNNCSFDRKTGIWSDGEREKARISELELKQKQILDIVKIYSSYSTYSEEISLQKPIKISKPKRNSSWKTIGLNDQNFLGNISLPTTDNIFLKKKIGKNKFSVSNIETSLLAYEKFIITTDDKGTIFKIDNFTGQIYWKKNIYKKIYKKINKDLILSIYKNNIYVADNVGFIYAISLNNGEIIWIKNHAIPLKSNIKIFNDKIYLIDQENKIFCLNTKDGTRVWSVLTINSFIKSQQLSSLAISKYGELFALNSSADIYKIDINSGETYWSYNTIGSLQPDATDFFESSKIVLTDNEIIFSAGFSMYSYDINTGEINWEKKVTSVGTPIIDGSNLFIVTKNGFFVIIDIKSGDIISSNNILKVLKKKKQNTRITGFVLGSGKIISTTLNGYLIISSATSGNVQSFRKIGSTIVSPPIVSDQKLFVITENSKIFGFN